LFFKGFARTVFWSAGSVNFYAIHNKSVLIVKVGVTFKLLWKIVEIETKYSVLCIVCGIVQAECYVMYVISSFKILPRLNSATVILTYLGLLKPIKMKFLKNE